MTAMHVLWGNAVFNGGLNNYADLNNPTTTRVSAMYCRLLVSTTTGYSFGIINLAQTYSDVPQPSPSIGSTNWAIGGFNLLLSESLADNSALIARYTTIYGSTMVGQWIPGMYEGRARTFIGYNQNTFKVVFGILSSSISGTSITDAGVTYYDMHKILKTDLGCALALNLDGGGSTRIKYKTNSAATPMQADCGARNVHCQLALTAAAESGCTWNGQ
jgi:hypothetical protein